MHALGFYVHESPRVPKGCKLVSSLKILQRTLRRSPEAFVLQLALHGHVPEKPVGSHRVPFESPTTWNQILWYPLRLFLPPPPEEARSYSLKTWPAQVPWFTSCRVLNPHLPWKDKFSTALCQPLNTLMFYTCIDTNQHISQWFKVPNTICFAFRRMRATNTLECNQGTSRTGSAVSAEVCLYLIRDDRFQVHGIAPDKSTQEYTAEHILIYQHFDTHMYCHDWTYQCTQAHVYIHV